MTDKIGVKGKKARKAMSRKQVPMEPDELFGTLDPDTRITGDLSEEHTSQTETPTPGFDLNVDPQGDQAILDPESSEESSLQKAFSQDDGAFEITFARLRSNLDTVEPVELTNSGPHLERSEDTPSGSSAHFYDDGVLEESDDTRQLGITSANELVEERKYQSEQRSTLDRNEVEIGSDGFNLPLSLEEARERINDPAIFADELVTRIEPLEGFSLQPATELESPIVGDHPQNTLFETDGDTYREPPSRPVLTISEDALVKISNGEAERFQREIAREALERLNEQTAHFGELEVAAPAMASRIPQADESAVAVIETRNTRTREVLLDNAEFSLAQRQIIENGCVNIAGKALVLEAVAITRQLPDIQLHRRRRRRA